MSRLTNLLSSKWPVVKMICWLNYQNDKTVDNDLKNDPLAKWRNHKMIQNVTKWSVKNDWK